MKKLNENQKTILNLVLCFVLGAAVTLAVTIPIHITVVRRANSKSVELSNRLFESERRLADATTEVTACRESITECRKSVERISEATRAGNGTLTDIINSLKRIRDEVQIMEKRISDLDNSSDNNNRNYSGADIPVE